MPEREVQDGILEKYGAHPDIRIWRQNTGLAYGYGQVDKLIGLVHNLGTMKSHGAEQRAAELYTEICNFIKRMQPTKYSAKGTPDLLGFCTYQRPDGRPWARTIGCEVKSPGNAPTTEQRKWGAMCESRGGIYIVAYTVENFRMRMEQEGFDV